MVLLGFVLAVLVAMGDGITTSLPVTTVPDDAELVVPDTTPQVVLTPPPAPTAEETSWLDY